MEGDQAMLALLFVSSAIAIVALAVPAWAIASNVYQFNQHGQVNMCQLYQS